MARGSKEFSYKIHEVYGVVSESETSNWGIALTKISWNNKAPVYDIRKFDMSTIDDPDNCKMGKGLSFQNEDALNNLVGLLIETGFGDTEKIKKLLKKRDSIFKNDEDLIDIVELY